ncbi:MAG: (d)CMP kinase [Patescibacteria group bacterium]
MFYAITIDGPAGSGKSTLARNLAKELKSFAVVDTGAYYRWATHLALEEKVDLSKQKVLIKAVKEKLTLDFMPYNQNNKKYTKYAAKVLFEGKDINEKLYTKKVTDNVSIVAVYRPLRVIIKNKIKELAKQKNIIVAGREIGTYVLPKAQIKFFIEPQIDVRVRRRYKDYVKEGRAVSLKELRENIEKRDYLDKNREYNPLAKPDDAFDIDNTNLLPSQTLKEALDYIYRKEPEIKKIKDQTVKELKTEAPKATASNCNGSSFQSPLLGFDTSPVSAPSSTSTVKSESIKELKKRLKAKYKSDQSGGSFWQKR